MIIMCKDWIIEQQQSVTPSIQAMDLYIYSKLESSIFFFSVRQLWLSADQSFKSDQ